MKKAILFLCDINGSLENTKEDYLEFNKILNSISEINENCTIIFSLISTEKEIIVKYPEECWHCRACAIDCPMHAITLRYPLSHMMLHVDVPGKE